MNVATNTLFVNVGRLGQLSLIAWRVCPEIHTQHGHILINLKILMNEMLS